MSSFHELQEISRASLSALRMSPDAMTIAFQWQARGGSGQGQAVLRRTSTRPGFFAPRTSARAASSSALDTSLSFDACKRFPKPSDPLLDHPEALRVVLPFKSFEISRGHAIGRYAIAPDFQPDFVRVANTEGPCTFELRDLVVHARSNSEGPCKARLFAVDREWKKKSLQWIEVRAVGRGSAQELDSAAMRELYSEAFIGPPAEDGCAFRAPTRDGLGNAFPNVLSLKLRRGTGIRWREGRFVLSERSLDGESEIRAFSALLATLSLARRHVVLPTIKGGEIASPSDQLERDIAGGGSRVDMALWHRVFLDVRDRSQLARIAAALAKNPAVSCVVFVRMPTVGPVPVTVPVDPLPWPSVATVDEFERMRGTTPAQGERRPPSPGRPPRGRPPIPK
jgi:hypothetical protein